MSEPEYMPLDHISWTIKDAIILVDLIASMLAKIDHYTVPSLKLVAKYISSRGFSYDDDHKEIIEAIAKHINEMCEE